MFQALSILLISLWFILSASAEAAGASADATAPLQHAVEEIVSAVRGVQATRASIENTTFRVIRSIPRIQLQQFGRDQFAGARKNLVPQVFEQRMALRQRLLELHRAGQLDESLARKVQRAMRFLRGVEDYLGYVDSKHTPFTAPVKTRVQFLYGIEGSVSNETSLLPASDHTLINPLYRAMIESNPNLLNLRSGDLLLSRGSAATSSAIARLGNEDTQFSHVGLVYIDPLTRKRYTIEAHLEFGVIITPIEEWFADGKKRTAIYRQTNTIYGVSGADRMAAMVRSYQRNHGGKNIPYDYSFNMNDHNQVFCSEVVRIAYERGSGGAMKVPLYPTHLTPKNRGFLNQLGIHEERSFIPADLDIDPRFELIAEWRNFDLIRESWISDAITTKIYDWMEIESVNYVPPFLRNAEGAVLAWARHTPIVSKAVESKIGPDASSQTISVMLTIEGLYKKLHAELSAREKQKLGARGTPFSFFEAMAELDKIRAEKPELITKVLREF